jgi:hypothetical protein
MMPMRPLLIILAATTLAVPGLHAQHGTARLEGTVTDSMHGRPLAGATVLVTRNRPEPGAWYSALTDARGRYRLDTLDAGVYTLGVAHAILDSLELTLPSRTVEVGAGQRVTVDLALPSRATLLGGVCPGVDLPSGAGALLGEVRDADGDRPLAGATLAVRWSDLTIDRATLKVSGGERTVGAPTNASGQFRICGVPTDSWLVVQVQHAARGGSVLHATVDDSIGVAVLNVAFSTEASRPLAESDSEGTEDSRTLPPLAGSASVSGTVLGELGQPLPGVQLRVLQTVAATRSDSTGGYAMSALPAGTQLLEAKRIGYRIVQQPVNLVRGRDLEVVIRLQRIVSLDSIRVVAQRSRYREFERQRRNGFGRFFTEEDIEKRHVFQVSDLLRMTSGFRIVGSGVTAQLLSSRGGISLSGAGCRTNVVIDGIQHQDINFVQPSDVGALEVYAGPAGAPVQYDGRCGMVVIWTKR